MGDIGDIDTASGDIGGDESVDLAVLEIGQGPLALVLGLVAMHRDGLDLSASLAQLLDQTVGAMLGPDEHQGAATAGLFELGDQGLELGLMRDMNETVLDLALLLL